MTNFTHDEINLMCIYNTGTREGLINELIEMRAHLDTDEAALHELTDSVIHKLKHMRNTAFDKLELFPDFDE